MITTHENIFNNKQHFSCSGWQGVQRVGAAQCWRGDDQAESGGPPQQRHEHLRLSQLGWVWTRHHRSQVSGAREIKVQRFSFQHCLYTASIFDILFYAFIRWTVTHLSPFDIKCRACEEEIISCVCVFKMFQLIDAAHPATFPKNVFVGIKPVSILTWRSIRYSWSWNLKARNSSKFSQVF